MVMTVVETLFEDCADIKTNQDYGYMSGYIHALISFNIITDDEFWMLYDHIRVIAKNKGINIMQKA